ncbi:unnamed protein product [Orchesella dallaii]|uniref:C-type lectin domain-containing protein n=1 Tax=Orchesella dallaii TaxID=48710 RepID=A0ABP1PKY9_9HEXA
MCRPPALVVSASHIDNGNVLGTVDGKTYVTTNANLNLNEAKAFCERNGWTLAKITSSVQSRLLKFAYDPVYFNGWYWVGAQYNENTEKFMWTETGQEVQLWKSLGFSSWSNEDNDQNCFIYSSNNHAAGYYFRHACHHEHPSLCESSQPIKRTHNISQQDEELKKIGTFGGKTYFSDSNIRKWPESEAICKSKGLQLASVSSNPAQLRFFKRTTKRINFDGWFWIAKPNASIVYPAMNRSKLETRNCQCFDARNGGNFERECFYRHFTLCESVNGAELERSINDSQEASSESSEEFTKLATWEILALLSDEYERLSAEEKQHMIDMLWRRRGYSSEADDFLSRFENKMVTGEELSPSEEILRRI